MVERSFESMTGMTQDELLPGVTFRASELIP